MIYINMCDKSDSSSWISTLRGKYLYPQDYVPVVSYFLRNLMQISLHIPQFTDQNKPFIKLKSNNLRFH